MEEEEAVSEQDLAFCAGNLGVPALELRLRGYLRYSSIPLTMVYLILVSGLVLLLHSLSHLNSLK